MEPFDLGLGAYDGHQYFKFYGLICGLRSQSLICSLSYRQQKIMTWYYPLTLNLILTFILVLSPFIRHAPYHITTSPPSHPSLAPFIFGSKKKKHIFVGHVLHIYNLNFLIDWLVLKSHCSSWAIRDRSQLVWNWNGFKDLICCNKN